MIPLYEVWGRLKPNGMYLNMGEYNYYIFWLWHCNKCTHNERGDSLLAYPRKHAALFSTIAFELPTLFEFKKNQSNCTIANLQTQTIELD